MFPGNFFLLTMFTSPFRGYKSLGCPKGILNFFKISHQSLFIGKEMFWWHMGFSSNVFCNAHLAFYGVYHLFQKFDILYNFIDFIFNQFLGLRYFACPHGILTHSHFYFCFWHKWIDPLQWINNNKQPTITRARECNHAFTLYIT